MICGIISVLDVLLCWCAGVLVCLCAAGGVCEGEGHAPFARQMLTQLDGLAVDATHALMNLRRGRPTRAAQHSYVICARRTSG